MHTELTGNLRSLAWWVPITLKRCNGIIAAVNNRYHKFGIEVRCCVELLVRVEIITEVS